MHIELRPIASIRPYENNPRINDHAVDAVAASIREFGFRQPIVLDSQGVIIAGHARYMAALKINLKKVPVHVAKDLTPEQIKAYRIADNQTADLSDWNYDLLPIELSELQDKEYDLSLLGFDPDELAELLDPGVKDGLCDPDEVPALPDEATTRPGDLWILGDHRLLCADSSKPEDVDRLLDGAQIHLVNTDPPYNVKVEPRSNNAIAAGLSSFQGTKHHLSMDLARHPEKAKPTAKKPGQGSPPHQRLRIGRGVRASPAQFDTVGRGRFSRWPVNAGAMVTVCVPQSPCWTHALRGLADAQVLNGEQQAAEATPMTTADVVRMLAARLRLLEAADLPIAEKSRLTATLADALLRALAVHDLSKRTEALEAVLLSRKDNER